MSALWTSARLSKKVDRYGKKARFLVFVPRAGVLRGELSMQNDDYLKVVSQVDVNGIKAPVAEGPIIAGDRAHTKMHGVTNSALDDPQFWKWRAEAAELLADEMNDEQGKAAMLRIAKEYHALAAQCVLKPRAAP